MAITEVKGEYFLFKQNPRTTAGIPNIMPIGIAVNGPVIPETIRSTADKDSRLNLRSYLNVRRVMGIGHNITPRNEKKGTYALIIMIIAARAVKIEASTRAFVSIFLTVNTP